MTLRSLAVAGLLAALTAIGSGCGGAYEYEEVEVASAPPPPPPARVEVVTVSPGPDYVWTAGHWRYTRRGYVWERGVWAAPRREHVVVHVRRPTVYVEGGVHVRERGHWERRGRHRVWVSAHPR